jgi:hypothetical protein
VTKEAVENFERVPLKAVTSDSFSIFLFFRDSILEANFAILVVNGFSVSVRQDIKCLADSAELLLVVAEVLG